MLHRSTLLFSLFFSYTFSLFGNEPKIASDHQSVLVEVSNFLEKNLDKLNDSQTWDVFPGALCADLRSVYKKFKDKKDKSLEDAAIFSILKELYPICSKGVMPFSEVVALLFLDENLIETNGWEDFDEKGKEFFRKVFKTIGFFLGFLVEKQNFLEFKLDAKEMKKESGLILDGISKWDEVNNRQNSDDAIVRAILEVAFKQIFPNEEFARSLNYSLAAFFAQRKEVESINKRLRVIERIEKSINDIVHDDTKFHLEILQSLEGQKLILESLEKDIRKVFISKIDKKNAFVLYNVYFRLRNLLDKLIVRFKNLKFKAEKDKENSNKNLFSFFEAILEKIAQNNMEFYYVFKFLQILRFDSNLNFDPQRIKNNFLNKFAIYDFPFFLDQLNKAEKFYGLMHSYLITELEAGIDKNKENKIEIEKKSFEITKKIFDEVREKSIEQCQKKDLQAITRGVSVYKNRILAGPYYEKDVLRINASFKKGGNKEIIKELKAAIDDHPRRVIEASLVAIQGIGEELAKLDLSELKDEEESYEKYLESLVLFIKEIKIRAIDKPNATILHNLYTTLRTIYKKIKNKNDQKKFFKVGTRIIQKIAKNNSRYSYPIVYLRSIFFKKNMKSKKIKIKKTFDKLIQDTLLLPHALNKQLIATERFYELIQEGVDEMYLNLCKGNDTAKKNALKEVKDFMEEIKPEFVEVLHGRVSPIRRGTFESMPKTHYSVPYNNTFLIKGTITKPAAISVSLKEPSSAVKKIKFCQIF